MMNQTGAKGKTQIRNHSRNFIVRRILDVGMTAAIVILLGFQITGQEAHEWMGITMTLLVVAHTVLNRSWYKGMVLGAYTPSRIFQTVMDLALLVCFVLTAVSGMLMSQYAVPFFRQERIVGSARSMHLAFSHWSYVLISAHLGMHFRMMTQSIRRRKILWHVLSAAAVLSAGYGLLLTIRNEIYSYMFFRMEFAFLDYSKAPWPVFLENILMMTSWALISYEVSAILRKPSKNDPLRRRISVGMIVGEFAAAILFSLVS